MNLKNVLDRIPVDNKLLTSLLTTAITRAVLAIGLNVDDPLVGTAISLAVGAIVGYLTPNEGSVLRGHGADDGNAHLPDDEAVPGELT
jgi:hypothetical protein